MGMANPNEGFVPISEPLEQQAPLDYGMPPAPTGMTVGEQGRRMRGVVGDGQEREGVTRRSCEQPEVVVSGESAAAGGRGYGNDVYEA